MTAKQEFEAFLAKQKSASYDFGSMTAEQQDAEQREYTRLKLAAQKEELVLADFYKQREDAFKALEAKYQSDRMALSKTWQDKENNL